MQTTNDRVQELERALQAEKTIMQESLKRIEQLEKSLAEASQTIIDRHEDDLKHCESDILYDGQAIKRLLDESEFKLNYVQLATSMIAYQHVKN